MRLPISFSTFRVRALDHLADIKRSRSYLPIAGAALALLLLPAVAHADDADTTWQYAQGLFDRKFYSLALVKYQRYLESFPTGGHVAEARQQIGECYYQLRDWHHAEGAFDQSLAGLTDPGRRSSVEARLGDCEYNQQQFTRAADSFRRASRDAGDRRVGAYSLYWLGESLLQARDFSGALKAETTLLDRYPQSDMREAGLLARGAALAGSGANTEAAAVFRALLEKYPNSPDRAEATFRLGDALYAARDYAGAEEAYRKLLSAFPSGDFTTDATDSLAWSLYKQGKYLNAAPVYEKVADTRPDEKAGREAALQAAICWIKAGQREKGISRLRKIAADDGIGGEGADAAYLLGKTLLEQKQYVEAMDAFRSFLTAHQDDNRAGYANAGLASAAAALNKYSDAAEAYQAALKSITDRSLRLDLLTGLLWAQTHLSRTAEANATRSQIAREYPNSQVAAASDLDSADRAFEAKQYQEALSGYSSFLKAHGDSPEAPRALYRALVSKLHLGQLDGARTTLQILLTRSPGAAITSDALLAVADGEFFAKQYRSAIEDYSRLLTHSPDSKVAPAALYGRASAEVLADQLDEAFTDFGRLAAEFPKDPNAAEASFRTGWIREKQNRLADAIGAYQQSLTEFPAGPYAAEAGFRLGTALAKAGQFKEADAAWEKGAASFPASPFAAQSLTAEGWSRVDRKTPQALLPPSRGS